VVYWRAGLVRDFPLTALGWILTGCVRSVEPEFRAPESGPPVSPASGPFDACCLLAVLIVNRLRRAHRLAVGAVSAPLSGPGISLTARTRGYV
jgi:hypothetical protein